MTPNMISKIMFMAFYNIMAVQDRRYFTSYSFVLNCFVRYNFFHRIICRFRVMMRLTSFSKKFRLEKTDSVFFLNRNVSVKY